RPQVGEVGNLVRRELVLGAVTRNERHPASSDLADHRVGRGPAVGGLEANGLGLLEERGEPGASEDPDLGVQALFPPLAAGFFPPLAAGFFSPPLAAGSVEVLPAPESEPGSLGRFVERLSVA